VLPLNSYMARWIVRRACAISWYTGAVPACGSMYKLSPPLVAAGEPADVELDPVPGSAAGPTCRSAAPAARITGIAAPAATQPATARRLNRYRGLTQSPARR
jgi:hypothetical protein